MDEQKLNLGSKKVVLACHPKELHDFQHFALIRRAQKPAHKIHRALYRIDENNGIFAIFRLGTKGIDMLHVKGGESVLLLRKGFQIELRLAWSEFGYLLFDFLRDRSAVH